MDINWHTEVLQASERNSETQELRFLTLVEQARTNLNYKTLKTLLKTYNSKPDYGTQERVESILAEADSELLARVILEEMPRLISEAPEWAEVLLGQEIEHRSSIIQQTLQSMPEEIKNAVKSITERDDFN